MSTERSDDEGWEFQFPLPRLRLRRPKVVLLARICQRAPNAHDPRVPVIVKLDVSPRQTQHFFPPEPKTEREVRSRVPRVGAADGGQDRFGELGVDRNEVGRASGRSMDEPRIRRVPPDIAEGLCP